MSRLCHHGGFLLLLMLLVLSAAACCGDAASDTDTYGDDRSVCQLEPYACGNVIVKYPFYLYNETEYLPERGQPQYCGYPGLAILCDGEDKPVLRLDDVEYKVLGINYGSLTVSLADADVVSGGSCPTVSHNVTLPKTFHLSSATAYLFFFLDCAFGPPELADFAPKPPHRKPPAIKPITCGSIEDEPGNMSFVLPERDVPPKDWWQACRSVYRAPVLSHAIPADAQDPGWRKGGYAKALQGGFQVSWDRSSSRCSRCEQSSGNCGYSRAGEFLGCLCADGRLDSDGVCSNISGSTAPPSVSSPESRRDKDMGRYHGDLQASGELARRSCCSLHINIHPTGQPSPRHASRMDYKPEAATHRYGAGRTSCGYPGFGILCDDDKGPILQLDETDSVVIRSIEREVANVSLADPDVLDAVTLPQASWLSIPDGAVDYLVFFLSCSFTTGFSRPPGIYLTTCLGPIDTPSFVLPEDAVPPGNWSQVCKVIQVPVLKYDPNAYANGWGTDGYAKLVHQGFKLAWNITQPCTRCEQSEGRYNESAGFSSCLCPDGRVSSDICNLIGVAHSKKIIYVVAGILSTLLLCLLSLISYKKYGFRRKSKETSRIESFLQKNGTIHPKRYTYAQVKRMTKSFAEKLGQGGFGAVYRGDLADGRQIAVKMLKDYKTDGEDFINEVASISRTSHVNIVTLSGFCLEGSKRALIYDYMPNGSLERYAFKDNSKAENTLSWEKLFDIAVGIARGLEYLHRGCNTRIVHFDIKPHNILLDQFFCPKISDFGLAKLCLNKESAISIGGARGTIGYIAPEVFSKQFGTVSSKSDVYSYGMMVLEMVGARDKNINANSESSSQYFPQWIYEHLDAYCVSASEINGEVTEMVRKMIVIGLWCIQLCAANRPTMTRVVEMLEGSTSDLELPPKMLLI